MVYLIFILSIILNICLILVVGLTYHRLRKLEKRFKRFKKIYDNSHIAKGGVENDPS